MIRKSRLPDGMDLKSEELDSFSLEPRRVSGRRIRMGDRDSALIAGDPIKAS
jgi:hypothetical protein